VRATPPTLVLALILAFSMMLSARAQAPLKKPAPPIPAAKPPAAAPAPAAPQSKHYPILILARGHDPSWSLRIGMKGPERLDRSGYPPLVLEPADVVRDGTADAWTYNAKDTATGAEVAVHLSRESCSEAAPAAPTATPVPAVTASASPATPLEKFPFRVVVAHTQIGSLSGCGRSSPELFPEFKAKNVDKDDEDKPPDDSKKKTVLDPITHFKMPAAVAYLDAAGKIIFSRSAVKKPAALAGYDLCISHDGKKLLFTHDEKGTERTINEFEFDTARSTELLRGSVRNAMWSPDDSQIAFLKFVDTKWQVWTMPAAAPERAALVYAADVSAIDGWADLHTLIVDDLKQFLWIGEDGNARQTIAEKELLGDAFNASSANTVRVHPLNPDLLLVSAEWMKPPQGVPVDSHSSKAFGLFLYEVHSKRRAMLTPLAMSAQNAEWSRDGLQIFFTATDAAHRSSTYRIFWDGSNQQKFSSGSNLAIGQ
jgi:hypothetical protein